MPRWHVAICLSLRLLAGLVDAAPAVITTNNLDGLIQNDKLKFVFVGGKGGVGKTTSSSAIAAQLSLSMNKTTNTNKRILLISTDPAHSLSDAFRMQFSNVPTPILPDLPNLEVMEVDPRATMDKELGILADLAKELGYDPAADDGESGGGIGEKIHSFQEWLRGIPGIDEATALSSAIEHIESGRYDMIVFDTAPTGHTLKLLELPKILQAGLDKLESWQATLWGVWDTLRGLAAGGNSEDNSATKEKVARKLKEYKQSIGRVASMITNVEKTRFVVVCIAEYLSVSETRRLLSELDRFEVRASHVVVNQLVKDYLEDHEMVHLEESLKLATRMSEDDEKTQKDASIFEKAIAAAKLTTARRNIQNKYLQDLKGSPEVLRRPDPADSKKTNRKAGTEPLKVLEVPLLPTEVTGQKAIYDFSHYLIGKELSTASSSSVGKKSKTERPAETTKASDKAPATEARSNKETKSGKGSNDEMKKMANSAIDMVMQDPELAGMIKKNPKLAKIAEEVKENPMAALQYMGDPEVQPFIQKATAKFLGGGGSAGKKPGKGGEDPMAALGGLLGGLGGLEGGGKKRRRRGQKAGGVDLGDLMKGFEL
eukprot:TRINITY_DN75203_c0_g1_i1.p1 TRINITY_DN75203_c0_g1~~TRINITY_DN75203_c0_g1_i1.p1  ORF type:complete len:625 (+),score=172.20 TRINITY_DN75203_c0_g1_i1:79-1875(+)